MSNTEVRQTVGSVLACATELEAAARQRELTKPCGSLGRLESLAVWMAARQGRAIPNMPLAAAIVYAADHGVAARLVSAYPACVTAQMVSAMAAGHAAVSVFARLLGVPLRVVDVGVAADLESAATIVHAKVRLGTADLSSGMAMTLEEAGRALDVGRTEAACAIQGGAGLLVAGEVGIGNTTASAALIGALLNADPGQVVGRGSGINDDALAGKVRVVAAALRRVRQSAITDPVALLANVGGLEIAAMAGTYLESARRGVPVILDGYISAAAALVAVSIEPSCRHWMLAGHVSAEPGHRLALDHLKLEPILDLGMRLGEGTGALLALPIVRAALAMHAEMRTFEETKVSRRL
ncbi:MAG: nicotinate-nucleotide--dimethylbenzimidazole phosphoribosyltransferase [Steroidobacteraceae bacterium]